MKLLLSAGDQILEPHKVELHDGVIYLQDSEVLTGFLMLARVP
jgi:hypothetical protein